MARQKWEYCIISYGAGTLGNVILVSFGDGVRLKYKGNEDELARVLTQLGSEGWETSGGAGSTQAEQLIWVLKRPA